MRFDAENQTFVIQIPALIKRSCIPKRNDPYQQPTFIGKTNEMDLLGFINLGLNEQEDHDFSE